MIFFFFLQHIDTVNTTYLRIGSFIFIQDSVLAIWVKFYVIFVGEISVSIYAALDTKMIGQHSTTDRSQEW